MRRRQTRKTSKKEERDGDTSTMINTGSTLLNLAISGGRVRGGGLPVGILVEIFGPSGSGKTVLLSEIAGDIQRQGGEIMFRDPEARLNKRFARIFGLDTDEMDYETPATVTDVFKAVREWKPPEGVTHGIFADSLAALSTDMEMEDEDKMGMRRAKEFSQELRKTCRLLAQKGYLMVCSNQIRHNPNAGQFAQKYRSPGGEAVGFYSSVRLKMNKVTKITKEVEILPKKKVKRVVGVEVSLEVFKNSVWKPHRTADLTIMFDYGIDDIRQNLKFIKEHTSNTLYTVGRVKLSKSLDTAIKLIEDDDLEDKLRREVIKLWEQIESQFEQTRKPKR